MRPPKRAGHEFDFPALPGVSRRRLLQAAGGSAAALAFALNQPMRATARVRDRSLAGVDPFTLGVASGDPLPEAVVIWTRLAPERFAAYGGMDPTVSVPVKWQVATDEAFASVVREGTATAHPEYYFSVHVDVAGLQPGTEYFYRFSAGGQLSRIGRTKTAPLPTAQNAALNFAFASCNSFNAGWFTSTGHLAEEDVDVVFFLGDYIYEYAITADGSLRDKPEPMPSEFAVETGSLSRYRLQYAAHKSDPNLIKAHARAPWIVAWDDHEVHNEYSYLDRDDPANADALVRQANAYRAYWEHMPLRQQQAPTGPDARLYRRFDFGSLARFSMLDARQFRSKELAEKAIPDSQARRDADRTMLGAEQEEWFFDSLTSSTAHWNIVPQTVLMGMVDSDPTEGQLFSPASWDGYQASQKRVLDTVVEHEVSNFVVLTGDIHRNYVLDLKANWDDPDSKVIGSEFAGTSLNSGGDGVDSNGGLEERLKSNPHLHWGSLQRGYVRCRLDRQKLEVDYREVPYVQAKGAPVETKKSFVVEAGTPGIQLP